MERQYFLFRKEWCDAVRELPSRIRLEVMDAVMSYGIYGEQPELGKMAKATFGIAKAVIDRDCEELTKRLERLDELEKEEEQRKRRLKENGRKGGRPRKTKGSDEGKPEVSEKKPKVSEKKPLVKPKVFDPEKPKVLGDGGSSASPCLPGFSPVDGKESQPPSPTNKNNIYINNLYNIFFLEKEGLGEKDAVVSADLRKRIVAFQNSLLPYAGKYDEKTITDFFGYWTELNKSRTRMRWEQQSTFMVGRRLAYWDRNSSNFKNRGYNNGNNGQSTNYDPRRGVEATFHTVEEYEEGF